MHVELKRQLCLLANWAVEMIRSGVVYLYFQKQEFMVIRKSCAGFVYQKFENSLADIQNSLAKFQ